MFCPLCEIWDSPEESIHTTVYFRSHWLIILDCQICMVPMGVSHKHASDFSAEEKKEAVVVCKELFGKETDFRWKMRKIHDHAHFHVLNVDKSTLEEYRS